MLFISTLKNNNKAHIMETILEDEQNASNKKSEDRTENNKTSPAHSVSNDESDFDTIKSNVRNEEESPSVGNSDTKLKFTADDDSSAPEINKTESKSESDAEIDSKSNAKDGTKNMNISFDEDIILPSVRHDTEQIEQKQRDRIKRKEMKSRKELEEEEREKMQ